MGQEPLAPPSVKGWDGGPTWINTATLLARFNYVNRIVKAAPPQSQPAMAPATMASTATAPTMTSVAPAATNPATLATFAAFTPDDIVRASGGFEVDRVLDTIARDAVQDDVTSDVRRTLEAYLESTGASVPVPLGPENYQEKIRGALALALNLPSNQLN
jgi:hypothetical protein